MLPHLSTRWTPLGGITKSKCLSPFVLWVALLAQIRGLLSHSPRHLRPPQGAITVALRLATITPVGPLATITPVTITAALLLATTTLHQTITPVGPLATITAALLLATTTLHQTITAPREVTTTRLQTITAPLVVTTIPLQTITAPLEVTTTLHQTITAPRGDIIRDQMKLRESLKTNSIVFGLESVH